MNMKRFALVLSLVIGAALFLSACDITITPGPTPPTPNENATAGTNPNSAVKSKTLAPGQRWLYRVSVPSSVSSNYDVLYVELDQSLNLGVGSASGVTRYSSSSASFFGRGVAGLASAAIASADTEFGAQSINPSPPCRGSCVIFQPGSEGTYLVEVHNTRSSSVSYNLFVYGEQFADEYEPRNNNRTEAPALMVSPSFAESGAIETVGDVDFWRVQGSGPVIFDATASQLSLRVELLNSSGNVAGSYQDGDTFNVSNGQYLRVFSSLDRAATAQTSAYYLSSP